MSLNRISAAEAASLIKHGYNIGLSGFTPAGTAKAVTAELAKIAEAEHAKGNPFQVGIFTGASTGESCDGVLSRAKAIRYRAPYTTNSDFRKAVNSGEIAYNDIHLSQMAQEVRYGFMGKVNVAIIEACEVCFHFYYPHHIVSVLTIHKRNNPAPTAIRTIPPVRRCFLPLPRR